MVPGCDGGALWSARGSVWLGSTLAARLGCPLGGWCAGIVWASMLAAAGLACCGHREWQVPNRYGQLEAV